MKEQAPGTPDLAARARRVPGYLWGDERGACVVVPCPRRMSNSIVSRHTLGGVDEGGERGRSEDVGRVGGAVL